MASTPAALLSSDDAAADPALSAASAALARKVIVDARRAVVGYQLSQDAPAVGNDDPRLFNTLRSGQSGPALGSKTAFVPCTFEQMADGHLHMLDPQKTVLEIPSLARHTPEGIAIRRSMLAHARSSGFKLAFDHSVLQPEYASWLPLAAYVKLDMAALEDREAERLARSVLSQTKASAMARHIGSAAQYERMKGVGVKLFEGLWFAQPPVTHDKAIQTSQAGVIKLLNLVMREAEVQEIEEQLKRDPSLSFKLLHFINSPGFGMNVEISSFRHAVLTVGLNGLFRWAVLLLTTARPGGPAPAAGTLAVVRGRMMELLAAERLSAKECDTAFVAGVFSMIDTLLGIPLDKAMELVNLPPALADAVVRHAGPFAPFLRIAKACEQGDAVEYERAREALGLSHEELNRVQLQALAWADQIEQ